MQKINLNNFINILYDIAQYVDNLGGPIERRKRMVHQHYLNRVRSDHNNDESIRESLVSLADSAVAEFIRVYYRYEEKYCEEKCCCCFLR